MRSFWIWILRRPGLSAVLTRLISAGSDTDVSYDIRVDANGLFYIAGYTLSQICR